MSSFPSYSSGSSNYCDYHVVYPHPFWHDAITPAGLCANDEYRLRLHLAVVIAQETCLWNRRFGGFLFLGFIPVIGNLMGVTEMIYELKTLKREFGIPKALYRRMLRKLAVPTTAAFVPILGSFAVAAYKPGTRNAELLCQFLVQKMRDRDAAAILAAGDREAQTSSVRVSEPVGNASWNASAATLVDGAVSILP